jgi:hypothetical protein
MTIRFLFNSGLTIALFVFEASTCLSHPSASDVLLKTWRSQYVGCYELIRSDISPAFEKRVFQRFCGRRDIDPRPNTEELFSAARFPRYTQRA